jgi:hypothetical protein
MVAKKVQEIEKRTAQKSVRNSRNKLAPSAGCVYSRESTSDISDFIMNIYK